MVAAVRPVAALLPAGTAALEMPAAVREKLAEALEPDDGIRPVAVARGLAELIDDRLGHTFAETFRRRSPYQPRVGDPVPVDSPDMRALTDISPTSPPWRLAQRLDETRRVRLAGEWASWTAPWPS